MNAPPRAAGLSVSFPGQRSTYPSASRITCRTLATTSAGTVPMLWADFAWAATCFSTSSSVSALTTPSQSNPRSRHRTIFGISNLLFQPSHQDSNPMDFMTLLI
jgi:hypothetical protein